VRYDVDWSDDAFEQLAEKLRCYAEEAARPDVGRRLVDVIADRINVLQRYSRLAPVGRLSGTRELTVELAGKAKSVIVYVVDDERRAIGIANFWSCHEGRGKSGDN
jgi:hypothetical protein